MGSNLNDVEFNYHFDLEEQKHEYPASDVQYIYVNDLNNGNYANNFVNFSNLTLVGASSEKWLDFSQAYLQIPFTVTATLTGAYWGTYTGVAAGAPTGMAASPENAFAVGCKPFHHLIDTAYLKFNGVPVNRNSSWNNFYMNEVLKKMSHDELRIMGELLNYSLDSADSLRTQTTANRVCEFNNNTSSQTINLATGHVPQSFSNSGHLDRMRRLNFDIAASNLANQGVSLNTIANSYQSCYIGPVNPDGNGFTQQIRWVYNSTIPLSKVHDFYARLPTINSTQGFEMRLQLNIGAPQQNNFTHSFQIPTPNGFGAASTVAASAMTALTCSASQSFGRTCPFIISPANVGNLGSGCTLFPSAYTAGAGNSSAVSITVSSQIGYNISGANAIPSQPCRLYVPIITYSPSYISTIIKQPSYKMLYRDFFVDQINSQQQGSSVSRLYNVQISRPRTLYVIPFLSSANLGAANLSAVCPPYQMLTSSAPTTSSPCKLRNFQVLTGGSPIFLTPLQYNTEYYDNNQLKLIAKEIANGNSYKSQFNSGLIRKRDWELAYGVYAFNIEKITDLEQDNAQKSFQLQFQIENNATNLAYDFVVIVDYETELYIDRSTGTITSA